MTSNVHTNDTCAGEGDPVNATRRVDAGGSAAELELQSRSPSAGKRPSCQTARRARYPLNTKSTDFLSGPQRRRGFQLVLGAEANRAANTVTIAAEIVN